MMGWRVHPDCCAHAGFGFYRYHFTLNRDSILALWNPIRGPFYPYIGPTPI
jgi:hypothetical protein